MCMLSPDHESCLTALFTHLLGIRPMALLRGKESLAPVVIAVQGAKLNCEYDRQRSDWKLFEWLQAAGVLGAPASQMAPPRGMVKPS